MNHDKRLVALGEWFRACGLAVACLIVVLAACPAAGDDGTAIPPARFLAALDLDGQVHRIGNGEGYQAVALVFLGTECPIAREYVPELNRMAAALADQPVKFVGVLSDPSLSRADAVKFRDEFQIKFPLLFDASGEIAGALRPTHVPEAIVLNPDSELIYRGRIDDRYAELGKKRPEPTTHDLADALTAAASGNTIAVAETTPVGCPIEPPRTPSDTKVTYNRDVAPLLIANCMECHRPGEVAPFSLLTYEDAAKRADFLAEITASRTMPPWKAEIGHGRFLGERQLTDAQISLLDRWAKAGAPEGNEADKPPVPEFSSGWRLGKPDLELIAPDSFTVAADGEDVFQHWIIPLDLPEDKTIVGFEFRPGNPAVVHHAILFLDSSGMGRAKDAETPEPGYTTFGSVGIPTAGIVGVWTPGLTPRFYPQNAGMDVRKGTELVLQLHMHPTGKQETDRSSVALYFADKDKPVARKMSRSPFVVGSIVIDIPAGEPEYMIRSSVTVPTDITLISLLPHMHLIGKEMKVTATFPDGRQESLIWIKDWNFYWQDNYVYHEPFKLPAGTKLDLVCRYDNSSQNPLNPSSPPERVFFGNGSADEMCFGIFQLIVDNPGEEQKLQGALLTTLAREWREAKLDDEARAHIMDEAGKLFGGGRRRFSLPGGGKPESPAEKPAANVETKPEPAATN
jgi:hypothetical protein